ncbi:hypothetical protein Cgig2_032644 [Carnegiea gigantea]|uniref:Uncharacterized protein n=1 Tax=Carnegiea gigantea TaxID=171969 RepID=A0A9Q1GVF9_9CARY|nr:hypothetical protein Cgig2_032644 [Carnegiea gigantea]
MRNTSMIARGVSDNQGPQRAEEGQQPNQTTKKMKRATEDLVERDQLGEVSLDENMDLGSPRQNSTGIPNQGRPRMDTMNRAPSLWKKGGTTKNTAYPLARNQVTHISGERAEEVCRQSGYDRWRCDRFKHLIENNGFIDLGFSGYKFTWIEEGSSSIHKHYPSIATLKRVEGDSGALAIREGEHDMTVEDGRATRL